MLRPLAVIMAAMYLSRPGMPYPEAERLAKVVRSEAKAGSFDPLSVVAIAHFESGLYPVIISADGEDYGLGQIRARYIGACKQDADPLNAPSVACLRVKASLLDGEENVRWVAKLITRNREFCKKKTGTAWFSQWLASYQGLNFASSKRWCQPKAKTWRVIKYHKQLTQDLLGKGGQLKRQHQDALEAKRKEAQRRLEESAPRHLGAATADEAPAGSGSPHAQVDDNAELSRVASSP